MTKPIINDFINIVTAIRKAGLYPDIKISESASTESKVIINGKTYLNFGSNNYLGLSSHPQVKKAVIKGIKKYGLGSGAPRILGGNLDIQTALERAIADYLQEEAAICFTTGYMANIGVIPSLAKFHKLPGFESILEKGIGQESIFLIDEYCHGSIFDGAKLSLGEIIKYRHNDLDDLNHKVQSNPNKRKIIITQGVFSTEGEITPLPEIVDIAKNNNAILMIDDADGVGVLGDNGRGTIEHYHLDRDAIDILMGSFTKAFGGLGGFIAGSANLMDYFRISAKTYLLSAPIPPSVSAGVLEAIFLAYKKKKSLEQAKKLAQYFRESLKDLGFTVLGNHPLIVPILIGEDSKCINFAQKLFDRGISVPAIRFPAVPWGKSRLRFTITVSHSKQDIEYVLQQMEMISH